MSSEQRGQQNSCLVSPGPYLARIISHIDPTYMGTLQVELMQESGNYDSRETQLHNVRYISPFLGNTSVEYNTESDDYNNTQKSYGMWMVPPDPGNVVVVMFIDGDPKKGFWFGCIQDKNTNFQVPGYAATSFHVDGDKPRVPVAEYNKLTQKPASDGTKIKKPKSPLQDTFKNQGTWEDDTRGITSSSARREIPSSVFGISTPGPTDKKGQKGRVGKHEHKIDAAFVSRLGGSSFVMDDGDDKWEREKKPTDGPPDYKSVENGENGIRDIPHNELIRLRTRTGHQILLHNSEDLIYIGNARGTAWIELTSDGKMDVFCEDSINFRTKKDFNFYADRDFNFEAGRNFNIKVNGEMHTHTTKDWVLLVDRDQKIQIENRVDETIKEQYRLTVHDHVKFTYKDDYTHLVKKRFDFKLGPGSIDIGEPPPEPPFCPYIGPSCDGNDPRDVDPPDPVQDVTGPAPDKLMVRIFKDTEIRNIGTNFDRTVDQNYKIKVGGNFDLNIGGHNWQTSGDSNETLSGTSIIETAPVIHMNGPTAATAAIAVVPVESRLVCKATPIRPLTTHELPDLESQGAESTIPIISILRRIPTYENYPHHENLDATKVKPTITDRDYQNKRYDQVCADSPTKDLSKPIEAWRKYTTATDTFAKVGK